MVIQYEQHQSRDTPSFSEIINVSSERQVEIRNKAKWVRIQETLDGNTDPEHEWECGSEGK